MRKSVLPITVLLVSTLLMYLAAGQQGLLVPIRASLEGYSDVIIGFMGTAYALGFVSGCYLIPIALRRVGYIRTFGVIASLAAASMLLQGMIIEAVMWFAARFVIGFSIAGSAMVIESWLNSRVTNDTRGGVFSVYMIIYLGAITAGQMSLTLFDPMQITLFVVAGLLFSISHIPTALTRLPAPEPPEQVSLNLRSIINLSPVGAVSVFLIGMANGAFGTLGPVFAQNLGFASGDIAIFMSLALVAGALAQWPFGRISDQMDRRKVIGGVAFLGSAAGVLMALFAVPGALTFLLVVMFGAAAYSLYGLAVAHANDHADPSDFVSVSGSLLLLFGIGSAIGPICAAYLTNVLGMSAEFIFVSAMHFILGAYAFYRIGQRAAVPEEEKEDFVGMARPTSPVAAEFDPRGEEVEEGDTEEDTVPPASSSASTSIGGAASPAS